ncbi:hypothetical protein PAMP_007432 [Pampus punctatissimus]
MNSLHRLSHGARRRITRVDSKQRGTVEPCAPHQLHSQHSHLRFSPAMVKESENCVK